MLSSGMRIPLLVLASLIPCLLCAAQEGGPPKLVRVQIGEAGKALDRDHVEDLLRAFYLAPGETRELEGDQGRVRVVLKAVARGASVEVSATVEERSVSWRPGRGRSVKVLKTHPARSATLGAKGVPEPVKLAATAVGSKRTYQLHVGRLPQGEHPILRYASWNFACLYKERFAVIRSQKAYDALLGTMRERMREYTPGRPIPPVALGDDRMVLLFARGQMDAKGVGPDKDASVYRYPYLRGKVHIKRVRIEPNGLVVEAKLVNTAAGATADDTTPLDAVVVPRLDAGVEFRINGIAVWREGRGLDPALWRKAVVAGGIPKQKD